MKKLLLSILTAATFSFAAQAKFITVNNNPGTVAMFTTIQPAIDSAGVGDTIFVSASNIAYAGALTIYKRIVLLGEGYKSPKNKLDNWARIEANSVITIDSTKKGFSPANSIVAGFYLVTNSGSTSYPSLGSSYPITLFNNVFYGTVNLKSKSVVRNSILVYLNLSGSANIISNCVIHAEVSSGASAGNNTISNSILFSSVNMTGGILSNNIFMSASAGLVTGLNTTLSKNASASADFPTNNLSNVDMTSVFKSAIVTAAMSWENKILEDFVQLVNSPLKAYGTDGKALGVYGGLYPWPTDRLFYGNPNVPKITNVEVLNAVVEPSGTLKINLTAKSFKKAGY